MVLDKIWGTDYATDMSYPSIGYNIKLDYIYKCNVGLWSKFT
jgi:hypothetical protein